MTRLRQASAIAAMSLLAWAATAQAECAWVFWLEAGDARTHESSSRPVSGWGTREACEQARPSRTACCIHLCLPPRHRGPARAEGEVNDVLNILTSYNRAWSPGAQAAATLADVIG